MGARSSDAGGGGLRPHRPGWWCPVCLRFSTPRRPGMRRAWNHGGERFPDGAHLVLATREGHRDAVPSFFASADAAVPTMGFTSCLPAGPNPQDRCNLGGPTWRERTAAVTTASVACVRPLSADGPWACTRSSPTHNGLIQDQRER